MGQTILMGLAALHFIVIVCFVSTDGFTNVTVFRVYPIVLAFGLGCVAVARFMGWPL